MVKFAYKQYSTTKPTAGTTFSSPSSADPSSSVPNLPSAASGTFSLDLGLNDISSAANNSIKTTANYLGTVEVGPPAPSNNPSGSHQAMAQLTLHTNPSTQQTTIQVSSNNHLGTQKSHVHAETTAATSIQQVAAPSPVSSSTRGHGKNSRGIKMAFKDFCGAKGLELGVFPSGMSRPTSITRETLCDGKKANATIPRGFTSHKSRVRGKSSMPVISAHLRDPGITNGTPASFLYSGLHILNPGLLNPELKPEVHPLAAAATSGSPTRPTSNFSAKERDLRKVLKPHDYTVGRVVFIRNIKKRGQGWRGHAGLIIGKWGKIVAVLVSTTFNGQGRDVKYEAMKYDHTGKWTEYGQHQYDLYTAFYLLLALSGSGVNDRLPVMQMLNAMIFQKETWLDLRAVRFVHENDVEKYFQKGSQREAFLTEWSIEFVKDRIYRIIEQFETTADVWPWKAREFEMMKKWRDAEEGRLSFPEEEPEWDDDEEKA